MHAGARDFLIKPFEIADARRGRRRRAEAAAARSRSPTRIAWRDKHAPWLLGNDPAMLPVLGLLSQVADTGCTVLITGESGTGKELAARSLHAGSARANEAVRRGELRRDPAEPGRVGAVRPRQGRVHRRDDARATGRFAQADGGTIFLDEIGEMETGRAGQAAAPDPGRRALPGRRGDRRTKIDVRILAATNRNLEREVAPGRFRADLFWRLNVIPIEMPQPARAPDRHRAPGRALPDARQRAHTGASVTGLRPAGAWRRSRPTRGPATSASWRTSIERMVIVKGSGTLIASPICRRRSAPRATLTPAAAPMPGLPEDGTDLRAMLEAVEDRMIGEALERTGGNKNRAAELLGLNRTTLVEKLRRKRGLTPPPT